MGFLGVSEGKESAYNAGDLGLIFGLGGNGYPLPDSGLQNPMDRGAWRASVHGVIKSRTQLKRLSAARHIVGPAVLC